MLPHDDREPLGVRIRWARELLDVTQAHFARMLSVQQSTISHWEACKFTPRPGKQRDIAAALGLTASYLACGDLRGLPAALSASLQANHPELTDRSEGVSS